MIKKRYSSIEEKEFIIAEERNKGLVLIEEQNLLDGNYLIFGDVDEIENIDYEESLSGIDILKQQLESTQEALDFLIMNGGV